MAEKIGLQAVLEDKDFQTAVKRYVSGLGLMDQRTAAMAQSAGGALAGVGGAAGLAAAGAMMAVQVITSAVSALTSGLREIGSMLADIGGDAVMAAGRVRELDIIVEHFGEQAGYSKAQLDSWVASIRDAGIRTDVAQQTVAEFLRYNLDLTKALELVRVAQGAASLANEDSSETLEALITATLTQNTLMLRRRGIVVAMGKVMEDYAATLGKEADDLTDAERAQAALNAVLTTGTSLIPLYGKVMESGTKQLRSMSRVTHDILIEMGMPFQDTFDAAVSLVYDFAGALLEASREGGWLNVILTNLGATVETLAAPIVSFGRTVLDVMGDINLVFGSFRGPNLEAMRGNIANLQDQIASLQPPDLSKGWEKEADEIDDINADLAASVRRLWDDVNRAVAEAMADWDRSRARELENWIRGQNRALEDFHASIAEIYADLDDRLAEMRGDREKDRAREETDWNEKRQEDLKRHENEMAKLQSDANMAQSKEEWDLIQQLIAQKEAEFQEERKLEQKKRNEELKAEEAEFRAEISREKARAQERATTMEREFNERREREEDDRRIRLEREREDFELRMARQREQAERSEADLRAAAAERTTVLQEEIAESQRRQQEAYEQQRARLMLELAMQRAEYVKSVAEMPLLHMKHAEESAKAYERLSDLFREQLGIEFDEIKKAWDEQDWASLGASALLAIWRLDWDTRAKIRGAIYQVVGEAVLNFVIGMAKKQAVGSLAMFGFVYASIGGGLKAIRAGISNIVSEFWNLGYAAMEAFGRGMMYLQDWIRGVANQLIWNAIQAALDALGIGSPSKVFVALGRNVDEAFAEGIRSWAHLPAVEMQRVAAGTMHSVVNNVTYYQNYNLTVNSGAPVEPVIADFHMMRAMGG